MAICQFTKYKFDIWINNIIVRNNEQLLRFFFSWSSLWLTVDDCKALIDRQCYLSKIYSDLQYQFFIVICYHGLFYTNLFCTSLWLPKLPKFRPLHHFIRAVHKKVLRSFITLPFRISIFLSFFPNKIYYNETLIIQKAPWWIKHFWEQTILLY